MTTPPLQPGQYWRTRAGEIRYVASIMPEWATFPFPVQVISRAITGQYRSEWYRLSGEWQNSGKSSHDLITYLPDCDSLDWVPPHQKKYYKTGTEHFGYFLVDSKDTYFWITPDGREVRQYGSPDTLKLPPFVEITKEEAETRVKRSDPVESPEDWVTQDRGPARPKIDERRYVDRSGFVGEWRDAGAISWGRPAFHGDSINGQKLELRCRRKDLPPVADPPSPPKPQSHHTAPEVWSLIENADEKNEERFGTPSHGVDKLLIRICSAQQSMLSELSAQVDALRSEKTNRGGCCGQPD